MYHGSFDQRGLGAFRVDLTAARGPRQALALQLTLRGFRVHLRHPLDALGHVASKSGAVPAHAPGWVFVSLETPLQKVPMIQAPNVLGMAVATSLKPTAGSITSPKIRSVRVGATDASSSTAHV